MRNTLRAGMLVVICLFLGMSCQTDSKEGKASEKDIALLDELVRKVMEWSFHRDAFLGFEPIYDAEGKVTGMDANALQAALNTFEKSDLFDREFISNYKKLVENLDRNIKDGSLGWQKDEMLPYAQADPWCNCQDIPYPDISEFWNRIDIEVEEIKGTIAFINWYWDIENYGREHPYKVEAKKRKGQWRISYLFGFDTHHIP